MPEKQQPLIPVSINPLMSWILAHDNSIVFNVLYIGLAIVLSIWLGLFWLVAVVTVHAIFELYRHYFLSRKVGYAVLQSFWELKLDIGLIVFAFWLAIYLDFIFGLAGLSVGARVAAQAGSRVASAGTRAAGWQRTIRGVFLTIDDAGLAVKAFFRRKAEPDSGKKKELYKLNDHRVSSSWRGKYSTADWLSISFLGAFTLLLAAAPLITPYTLGEVWQMIAQEMKPFP